MEADQTSLSSASYGKQEVKTKKISLPAAIRSMIYDGRDPFADNALAKGLVHCHHINSNVPPPSSSSSDPVSHVRPPKSSEADNMNLTGCPMEVSFDVNDVANESCLDGQVEEVRTNRKLNMKPLDLTTARQRLNEKCDHTPTDNQELVDWAVCDGLDNDKTLFLGRECGWSATKHKGRRHVTLHKVNFAGQVTATSGVSYRSHLEALVREHLSKQAVKTSLSRKARVEYNMASNLTMADGETGESSSRAALTVEWDNPAQVLERPQATYRSAHVSGEAAAGDPRSSCHPLFLELKFLENLVGGLTGGEEEGEAAVSWNDDPATAIAELKDLLAFCKDQAHSSAYDVTGEHFPGVEVSGSRTLVDFLDLLWSPLKKVESYSQLCCLWKQIFQTLSHESIRPYIHPQNFTRLAQIVRSVIRDGSEACRGLDLSESSSLSLELLVELGKEKLRRDHIEFFIRSNLMSKLVLDEYIQPSDDNSTSLDRLRVLHQLQEMCATLQCDTVIEPVSLLRPVLEEALKVNSHLKQLQPWTFHVPVRGELVKQLVAKLVPNTWQCELTSEGDSVSVRTVGNLSLDSPSPFCPDPRKDDSTADEDVDKTSVSDQNDNVTYYFTTSFSIKRFV